MILICGFDFGDLCHNYYGTSDRLPSGFLLYNLTDHGQGASLLESLLIPLLDVVYNFQIRKFHICSSPGQILYALRLPSSSEGTYAYFRV